MCWTYLGVGQQLVERLHDDGTARNESSVKIRHANEPLEFALRGWLREISYGVYVFLERCDATTRDMMTKKVKGVNTKDRFGWIHAKAVHSQTLLHLTDMLYVLIVCSTRNEQIINIPKAEVEAA